MEDEILYIDYRIDRETVEELAGKKLIEKQLQQIADSCSELEEKFGDLLLDVIDSVIEGRPRRLIVMKKTDIFAPEEREMYEELLEKYFPKLKFSEDEKADLFWNFKTILDAVKMAKERKNNG